MSRAQHWILCLVMSASAFVAVGQQLEEERVEDQPALEDLGAVENPERDGTLLDILGRGDLASPGRLEDLPVEEERVPELDPLAGPPLDGEGGLVPPLPEGEGEINAAMVLPDAQAGDGPGVLEGVVFDKEGQGIPGVIVVLPDQGGFKVRAGPDGRFRVTGLPASGVALLLMKSAYVSRDEVVQVKAEGVTTARFSMELRPIELAEGEYNLEARDVILDYEEEGQTIAFDNLGEGLSLQSGIGRDEFAKKNLSTAADAVSKISGTNVVDGKRPVVRGLADRYITTTVNGGIVVSTQPLRKAVELDLFPTSVIEDIQVAKVYNATLPGDFGGAAIDIFTRSIPEERKLEVKLKSGLNSIDAGSKFYVSNSPDLTYWGEASFPNYRDILQLENDDLQSNPARAGERAVLWGQAVQTHDFLPKAVDQEFDLGYSLYYGDSWDVGAGKLGVVYTLARDTEDRAQFGGFQNNGSGGIYNYDRFNRSVDWSQLLGVTWRINDSHEVKGSYFKKHIGSSEATHIYNWEDEGEFEIQKEIVLQGGLYTAYGSVMSEIIGGDFWGIQLEENSLEIMQLAGRHKLFGHSLDEDEGAMMEWALTRSENEVKLDTSVARRIEVSFDTPAIRELAAGTDVDPAQFVLDTSYGDSARTTANANFRKPRFGSDPDRPLTTTQIAGINTWSELETLLTDAGVSMSAFDTYNMSLDDAIAVVEAPRTDTDFDRGTQFSNFNGITPNQLKSFKENYPQLEKTDHFKTDFTFPFLLGGDPDHRITLRTGLSHELRRRSERSIEVQVDNGTYQEAGFDIGADPSQGYSDIFTGFTDGSVPFLNPIDTTNVSAARNIDVEQTIRGYYVDGEYRLGDFVFRAGGRHEDVEKFFNLIGLGSSQSASSADTYGLSTSYTFDNDFQILAAFSNTVARPVIKEQLPIRQIDRSNNQSFTGNRFLDDTMVQSVDVAMIFPEVFGVTSSVTFFHKALDSPIVYLDTSGDIDIINGDSGTIEGVELEAGVELPAGFSLDANYAYILGNLKYNAKIAPTDPDVDLESTFPEQPKHVFNVSLNYANVDARLNANLSYNYVSEYVVTLPRSDVGNFQVQQPAPQLDFALSKGFDLGGTDLTVGLSVKNILDSDDEVWNESYIDGGFEGVRSSLERGRTFGIWAKAAF